MNNSNSTTENSDITAANEAPKWVTQFTGYIELIFTVVALFGNIVFVVAVLIRKRLRTTANLFLVNLAFTDIIAALLVSTFAAAAHLRRGWFWGHTYCIVHSVIQPFLLSISLYVSACIAFNRYVYIVHREKYQKINNKFSVVIFLLFSWLFPIIVRGQQFLKSPFFYSSSVYRCRYSTTQVITALIIYVPCAIVVICYTRIFIYVRKSRLRVQAHQQSLPNTATNNTPKGPSKQELRMIAVFSSVFILILMGYLPFIILVSVYQAKGQRPPVGITILLYPCLHLAGVLNPIIYGLSNRHFRAAYKDIFTKFSNSNSVIVDVNI
ncbi:melatonin receptor type 1A-like [Saccoglossus kowalevskii]|uniref:Melatonin receptor type 1B-B-like n=1 Tax=Saccoglossus kowalevskii TaxID=10224 RepID=A0ABM0M6Y3_SACKO|nr:PREDICTED: melatonin receptor type 1B-B-like [Saccoglossus kowalevskii]